MALLVKAKELHLKSLNDRIKQPEEEQKQTIDACVQCASFLKDNAIASNNDYIGIYLDHLIKHKLAK